MTGSAVSRTGLQGAQTDDVAGIWAVANLNHDYREMTDAN